MDTMENSRILLALFCKIINKLDFQQMDYLKQIMIPFQEVEEAYELLETIRGLMATHYEDLQAEEISVIEEQTVETSSSNDISKVEEKPKLQKFDSYADPYMSLEWEYSGYSLISEDQYKNSIEQVFEEVKEMEVEANVRKNDEELLEVVKMNLKSNKRFLEEMDLDNLPALNSRRTEVIQRIEDLRKSIDSNKNQEEEQLIVNELAKPEEQECKIVQLKSDDSKEEFVKIEPVDPYKQQCKETIEQVLEEIKEVEVEINDKEENEEVVEVALITLKSSLRILEEMDLDALYDLQLQKKEVVEKIESLRKLLMVKKVGT
ncbi:uncharacterized protein LOC109603982 [Aethina tumida]|uniref:uncharacterized protein LOC109603982 n=1 Tax=Aethina tumida TaxID=116153 RepID=UPI0021497C24|nr:uncharacterized protein LOC109603982 [Aethina tumida]